MDRKTRKGESAPYPFRATRIFHANGAWYFSTRDGGEMGPFADRREAEISLLEYLRGIALQEQRMDDPELWGQAAVASNK